LADIGLKRIDMSRWNSISKEIPRINTYVFMMNKSGKSIGYGKLCVYLDTMSEEAEGFFSQFEDMSANPPDFTEGDIFWKMYGEESNIENNVLWGKTEDFPYWILEEDLIKFVIENGGISALAEVEKIKSRSQILDIRD
jgi:hypothetical protein